MYSKNLTKINGKILIIGSVYDKFIDISNLLDKYQYIIYNGNICYPFNDLNKVYQRIDYINNLYQTKKVIYNLGNYDLKLLSFLLENNSNHDLIKWILSKSNLISIKFEKGTSALIINGGVLPENININSLENNIEISFLSYINDEPWHNFYNGRFGYIISNNPLNNDKPIFYNYSMQLGTKYDQNNTKIYAQEIDGFGLKETILL